MLGYLLGCFVVLHSRRPLVGVPLMHSRRPPDSIPLTHGTRILFSTELARAAVSAGKAEGKNRGLLLLPLPAQVLHGKSSLTAPQMLLEAACPSSGLK